MLPACRRIKMFELLFKAKLVKKRLTNAADADATNNFSKIPGFM